MADLEVVIKLPEALVERAKAVGLQLDEQTDEIIALLESRIRRQEADQALHVSAIDIENQLAAMAADPDVQREIKRIEMEFAGTESDGLADK